jgi:cell division protein FtsW
MEARLLHWLTFLWLGLGLAVLFSASYYTGLQDQFLKDGLFYFNRQLLWIAMGLVGFFTFLHLPLKRSLALAMPGFFISLLLIFATYFMGTTTMGATRWLSIAGFQLQPSEIMKPFLVLQSAWVFGNWPRFTPKTRWFWLGCFAITLLAILRQPNLSTTALCGISLWLIALAAGLPYLHLFATAGLGLIMAGASVAANGYQQARILSFLNPWKDQMDTGYQLVQSLLAVGSGGVWGTGFGFGQRKLFYLPIQHTDFIFSVYAEEFGLIGGILLMALLTLYGILAVRVAAKVQNPVYRLVAVGAMVVMLLQAIINIGVSIGALPTTGLPFPLFSYGGSSMIASLAIAGLLIRVAREGTQAKIIQFPGAGQEQDVPDAAVTLGREPATPAAVIAAIKAEPRAILSEGSLAQRREALVRRRKDRHSHQDRLDPQNQPGKK